MVLKIFIPINFLDVKIHLDLQIHIVNLFEDSEFARSIYQFFYYYFVLDKMYEIYLVSHVLHTQRIIGEKLLSIKNKIK